MLKMVREARRRKRDKRAKAAAKQANAKKVAKAKKCSPLPREVKRHLGLLYRRYWARIPPELRTMTEQQMVEQCIGDIFVARHNLTKSRVRGYYSYYVALDPARKAARAALRRSAERDFTAHQRGTMRARLEQLSRHGCLYSITTAHAALVRLAQREEWPTVPSRALTCQIIRKFDVSRSTRWCLSHAEEAARREVFERELYLSIAHATETAKRRAAHALHYPASFIVNIDELVCRMWSPSLGSWVLDGHIPKHSDVSKTFATVLLGHSAAGDVLKPQVVWHGSTPTCHAHDVDDADLVLQSHSANHWCSDETMVEYVMTVLQQYHHDTIQATMRSMAPHVEDVSFRDECELHEWLASLPLILVLDHAPVHTSTAFQAHLQRSFDWLRPVFVPKRTSWPLQPVVVGFGGPFELRLQELFDNALVQCFEEDRAAVLTELPKIKALFVTQLIAAIKHFRTTQQGDMVERAWGHLRVQGEDPATVAWRSRMQDRGLFPFNGDVLDAAEAAFFEGKLFSQESYGFLPVARYDGKRPPANRPPESHVARPAPEPATEPKRPRDSDDRARATPAQPAARLDGLHVATCVKDATPRPKGYDSSDDDSSDDVAKNVLDGVAFDAVALDGDDSDNDSAADDPHHFRAFEGDHDFDLADTTLADNVWL